MATKLPFDELNALHDRSGKIRSVPFKKYFGEMQLPRESINQRIDFAEKLESDLFDILAFLFTALSLNDPVTKANAVNTAKQRVEKAMMRAIRDVTVPDTYLTLYAQRFANDFVDTTTKHQGELFTEPTDESEEIPEVYYFSHDRAKFNAENESNTFFNYEDFRDAVRNGMTQKTWVAIMDAHTRETHAEVDGVTIPIQELFLVGDSLMAYPKDTEHGAGPEEIVNCRCTLSYS